MATPTKAYATELITSLGLAKTASNTHTHSYTFTVHDVEHLVSLDIMGDITIDDELPFFFRCLLCPLVTFGPLLNVLHIDSECV